MIDIHSHILPKIDDGSEDMMMSLDIAQLYIENGINKVIATPHYIEGDLATSPDEIRIGIEALKKELFKAAIPLEIYPGNEIYISPDTAQKVIKGEVLSLNDSSYVLIEFPMHDIPLYTEEVIYELRIKGLTPIIAHPERYSDIVENPNILFGLIGMGAMAQVNLPSLDGLYGSKVKNTAEILLKHNMIHFIGTDTHSNKKRSPQVKKSLETLRKIVGEEEFNLLTRDNPQKVLDNRQIEAATPIKVKKRKFRFPFQSI